jgi:hypothetical protein
LVQKGWSLLLAGKRKARSPSKRRQVARVAGALGDASRRHLRGLLSLLGVLVVLAGVTVGLSALKSHVYALPEYNVPVTVALLDQPPWLDANSVNEMLAGLPELRFLDETASSAVAEYLSQSGWIAKVNRAEMCRGGRIEVSCEYRQPVAVVQVGARFHLVDCRGVRLPGVYSEPGEFLIIQGVRGPVPAEGQLWNASDLQAGLRLATLILSEPFANQVGAVSVHNYGGRESAGEPQLALLTRPEGNRGRWGRVLWGSGPGEEIEEPTAREKILVLRANFQQCGRIDAGASWIDVSINPGEYRRPAREQPA